MIKINSQKGFTLVEMLVVVAIIAILASVFLVGLRGFRGTAYDSRRISDLQKVQSYLELYYNQNRMYPIAGDWTTLSNTLKNAGLGISSLPNDPLGVPRTYYYTYDDPANPQKYVLGAIMSDANSKTVTDQKGVLLFLDEGGKPDAECGNASSAPVGGVFCASAE
ncbi:MAG TPA: prepilin-type N-terminal cleavage/methylation domain-containing protein [Candidatus Paceibacterota bacterium]|nr:prepilin-type N-terminal cleavage/methylation domain-containing protein [Candidatus Paceibacterota bacterium]